MATTSTGSSDLLAALRAVLIEECEDISAAGIFLGSIQAEDPMPAFVLCVKSNRAKKKLGGAAGECRMIQVSMKAVSSDVAGETGYAVVDSLANSNYQLWTNGGGLPGQALLAAILGPVGWQVGVPVEMCDIGPYNELIDKDERWHTGHLFLFTISTV